MQGHSHATPLFLESVAVLVRGLGEKANPQLRGFKIFAEIQLLLKTDRMSHGNFCYQQGIQTLF